jgi:hypothetical protein
VAELADAQVSEACDGDIVEVQVLSSAPKYNPSTGLKHPVDVFMSKIFVTDFRMLVFS